VVKPNKPNSNPIYHPQGCQFLLRRIGSIEISQFLLYFDDVELNIFFTRSKEAI
jgi:hypothetical protein